MTLAVLALAALSEMRYLDDDELEEEWFEYEEQE